MPGKKKFYITTTLPYVNANPHIGHTLEFIQADVISRFMRQSQEVFFNVGTDEHGQKILEKSVEEGLEVQNFVDKYSQRFKDFCKLFDISYDNFYRTSDDSHIEVAQKMRSECDKNGDIYKKKYSGLYCVGCESFKTEKDLIDGNCPDHGKPPIKLEEENYFFKLSAQKNKLLKYIKNNKDFIKPYKKTQELVNFVEDMQDISISRLAKNLPWGIEVPNDKEQKMYVWFDALSNYFGAVKNLNGFWPPVQICGPDNLRFQGAIWQGMLASSGLDFSKRILVHGTIFGPDGNKMSKTLGNVISPFDQLEKYGPEAIRFYMIFGLSTYGDSSYKEQDLVNICNSCLADAYGNLLNRVIHLSNKKNIRFEDFNLKNKTDFIQEVNKFVGQYQDFMNDFELQDAFQTAHKLALFGNKHMDENKPWDKTLEESQVNIILQNLLYLLQKLTKLYSPLIPNITKKAFYALENMEKIILFEKIELK